ncbi:MAG: hypothetical protein AAF570_09195, partial [Bacteroidota bacterium]
MKTILTIFRKELLDTLRDKRTLRVLIILPLFAMPAIFLIISTVASSLGKSEATRTLNVGYYAQGNDMGLAQFLGRDSSMKLIPVSDTAVYHDLIHNDSIDLGLAVFSEFGSAMAQLET